MVVFVCRPTFLWAVRFGQPSNQNCDSWFYILQVVWNTASFANSQDKGCVDTIDKAFAREHFRSELGFVHSLVRLLDSARSWVSGCPCHEEQRMALGGPQVDCPMACLRFPEADRTSRLFWLTSRIL